MKHELVCYSCSQCYYKATTNGSIFNKHVETIHEGVCYTCSQWDYKATTTLNLKRHVEAINELVCYSCKLSQCNGSNNKRLGNEETETNKDMSRHHVYIHNYVNFEVASTVITVVLFSSFRSTLCCFKTIFIHKWLTQCLQ